MVFYKLIFLAYVFKIVDLKIIRKLRIQIIDVFYASHTYMLVRRAVDTSRISNEVNENGVAQSIVYCRYELICSFCR